MSNMFRRWLIYKSVCNSLEIFDKWADIGLINGQILQEENITRWHADISGQMSLHKLINPRQSPYAQSLLIYILDGIIFKTLFKYSGINIIFRHWQMHCYRMAYKEVLTKYSRVYHAIQHINVLDKKLLIAYFQSEKYDWVD